MSDEPKIQAAIDAALESAPEDPPPNPNREVPMPFIFTRVEDFLNTPLFESKKRGRRSGEGRLSPGALLNVISCLAGLASISAALYWYSSAMKYQKLSADLVGELRIALEEQVEPDGASPGEQAGTVHESAGSVEVVTSSQDSPSNTTLTRHERSRQDSGGD